MNVAYHTSTTANIPPAALTMSRSTLAFFLKAYRDLACLIARGKLFHSRTACTENDLSAN